MPCDFMCADSAANTWPGVFAALVLGSGYLGLAPITIPTYGPYGQSDKGLHFIAFFLLSVR